MFGGRFGVNLCAYKINGTKAETRRVASTFYLTVVCGGATFARRIGFRYSVRFGGFSVRITPIVCLIESAAAKHDGSPSADQSTEAVSVATRTRLERGFLDILEFFKFMGAGIAMIIVCRH